jgi:hypothetical protein
VQGWEERDILIAWGECERDGRKEKMPKVTEPLGSEAARGQFGKQVDFQVVYGETRVHRHRHPVQPGTERQKRVWAIHRTLHRTWALLSREEVAAWRAWAVKHPLGGGDQIYIQTGFNAFCGLNFYRLDWGAMHRCEAPLHSVRGVLRDVRVVPKTVGPMLEVYWDSDAGWYPEDRVDVWMQGPLAKAGQRPRDVDFRHVGYGYGYIGNYGITGVELGKRYYVRCRSIQYDGQRRGFITVGPETVV